MVIPFEYELDNGQVDRMNASDLLSRASLCRKAIFEWNSKSQGHRRATRVVRLEGIVARFHDGSRVTQKWDIDL